MFMHSVQMCLPVPLGKSHHSPHLDQTSNCLSLCLPLRVLLPCIPDQKGHPSGLKPWQPAERRKAPNWQLNRKSAFYPLLPSHRGWLLCGAPATSLQSAPWTELPLVLGGKEGYPRNPDSVSEGPQGLLFLATESLSELSPCLCTGNTAPGGISMNGQERI